MTFHKFEAYLDMYRAGVLESDQTYKWYDLLHSSGPKRFNNALRKAGFGEYQPYNGFQHLKALLRSSTSTVPDDATLRRLLMEWYVWQRIADGEYSKWPYRKGQGRKRVSTRQLAR